jgi:hypothetical protein
MFDYESDEEEDEGKEDEGKEDEATVPLEQVNQRKIHMNIYFII